MRKLFRKKIVLKFCRYNLSIFEIRRFLSVSPFSGFNRQTVIRKILTGGKILFPKKPKYLVTLGIFRNKLLFKKKPLSLLISVNYGENWGISQRSVNLGRFCTTNLYIYQSVILYINLQLYLQIYLSVNRQSINISSCQS